MAFEFATLRPTGERGAYCLSTSEGSMDYADFEIGLISSKSLLMDRRNVLLLVYSHNDVPAMMWRLYQGRWRQLPMKAWRNPYGRL